MPDILLFKSVSERGERLGKSHFAIVDFDEPLSSEMSQQQANIVNQSLFREYVSLNSNDIPPASNQRKTVKSESKPNLMLMAGGYNSSTPNLSKNSISNLSSKGNPYMRANGTSADRRSAPSNHLQVSGIGVSGSSFSRPASGDVTSKLNYSGISSKSPSISQILRPETAQSSRPASKLHNHTVKSMSNLISPSAAAAEKGITKSKICVLIRNLMCMLPKLYNRRFCSQSIRAKKDPTKTPGRTSGLERIYKTQAAISESEKPTRGRYS